MTDRFSGLRLGLVGAWCPSLGGDGNLVADRSGRGNHAVRNGASLVARPGGVAVNVATNNYQQSRTATTLGSATRATLSFWAWKSSASNTIGAGFLGYGAGPFGITGARFSALWFSDNTIYAAAEAATSFQYVQTATFTPTTGWIHIAVTYDGNIATATQRATVYVNGIARTLTYADSLPATLSADMGPLALGQDAIGRACTGSVDDVRVYNRVLTLAGIRLLASQRGIGLVPTRHRRASALSQFWLRQSGVWSRATPFINVGGTWKRATPKIRVGGVWKG